MKKILVLTLFVVLTFQKQAEHRVLTIRENLLHLIEKDEWFFYVCSHDEPDCATVNSFFEELSMKFPRITFGYIPSVEKNIFRYLKVDEIPTVYYANNGIVYTFSENVGYKSLIKFLRSNTKTESVKLLGKLIDLIDEGSVRKILRLTPSELGKISTGNWVVYYDGVNSKQSHLIKDGLEQAYADNRFPNNFKLAIVDAGASEGENIKCGTDIYPSYFLYIRKDGKTKIYRGPKDLSKDGVLYFLNNYETEGRLAVTQIETPRSTLRVVVGTMYVFTEFFESLFEDISADYRVMAVISISVMLTIGIILGILIGACGKKTKKVSSKKDDGKEETMEPTVLSKSRTSPVSKRKSASSAKKDDEYKN